VKFAGVFPKTAALSLALSKETFLDKIVALVRAVQFQNAPPPMEVTLLGITMLVKVLQS